MSGAPEPAELHARELLLARYYDLETRDVDEDVGFYVRYAEAMDPERTLPVLELGSGTGRVALALADSGFKVTALESSAAMLEILQERAAASGVASRLTPAHADMRRRVPGPDHSFNLAICALDTFAYLLTTADQLAMLGSVHRALVQHGLLLVDLGAPSIALRAPDDGEVFVQGRYPAAGGGYVSKLVSGWSRSASQCHDYVITYDHEEPNGALRRTSHSLTLRWTGRYEMELLLGSAGYRLERVYGNYELDDFSDDSERMVFVARS